MGYTNSTPNLHLPQFIGSDKPTWLSDVNGAMLAIDTAYGTIEAEASSAATAAAGAVTVAGAAQTAADSAATAAATAGTNASQALSTANNAATVALQAQTDATKALEIVSGKVLATVTADGVKTYSDILNELYTDLDRSELTNNAALTFEVTGSVNVARIVIKDASNVSFALEYIQGSGNGVHHERLILNNSASKALEGLVTSASVTFIDKSSNTPTNGTVFKIHA